MPITKKITKIGNSFGVIIPLELLTHAGLKPGKKVDIEAKSNTLYLRAHENTENLDQKVAQATARFIKKYRLDLKKLAT